MRSSTSSFEREIPGRAWGQTWLLAVVIACAILGSLEITFRRAGHRPSIFDDEAFWSLHRDRIYKEGTRTPVVLLGASRIQLGFVLEELTLRYPHYRPVQLAIDGRYPWATLKDMALDEKFNGIVICSIKAEGFRKTRWDDQAPYVAFHHNRSNLNSRVNTRISSCLQSRLTLIYPTLRLDTVLLHMIQEGSIPRAPYLVTYPDRSRAADYLMIEDLVKLREQRMAHVRQDYADRTPLSASQWLSEAMQIEPYVEAIQKRGGEVVFVRFPSSGEYWENEERSCPKAQFWDVLADKTDAVMIHFKDFPELARFDCPDNSHLDFRDAIPFTRSLLTILEQHGILTAAPPKSQPADRTRQPMTEE